MEAPKPQPAATKSDIDLFTYKISEASRHMLRLYLDLNRRITSHALDLLLRKADEAKMRYDDCSDQLTTYNNLISQLDAGVDIVLDDIFCPSDAGPGADAESFAVTCPFCGIRQIVMSDWGTCVEKEHCRVCRSELGEANVSAERKAHRDREAAKQRAERDAERAPNKEATP